MFPHATQPLSLVKFGIREARAFVAHSFAEDDKEVVERICVFLSKLGVTCDSGQRAEPMSVSEKVLSRLLAAELFVGIFTRRERLSESGYSTSPWLIEEKAAAIQAGKRLLLFVENGVEKSIGGLQGDYEYIPFDRLDLADALLRAMDYVMTVTTVPFQCRIDPATRSVNVTLGARNGSPEAQLKELARQKELKPNDVSIAVAYAQSLERNGQREAGISELQALLRLHPQAAGAHHQLGHLHENAGQIEEALISYQNALDRAPNSCENSRCFGKCLYQKAKTIANAEDKLTILEKAMRLLQRAIAIGGESQRKNLEADLFLIEEALADCR